MVSAVTEFATTDFYLACFLRCSGYDLLRLQPVGRGPRREFVFSDLPRRERDVMDFYRDVAKVPALQFARSIKDMKSILHNA